MSQNQKHGKLFEDFIKGCGLFPGAADGGRSPVAGFDIEARFDRHDGLPTSIKVTGGRIVTLSDARRFFAVNAPLRIIVGHYQQIGDTKSFGEIHQFVLSVEGLKWLRGEISLAEVEAFHLGLMLNQFPIGMHVQARIWARQRKTELAKRVSRIKLDQKIGSDSQRRLQCSVRLADLIEAATFGGSHTLHTERIGDSLLPQRFASGLRQFRPKEP